MPEPVDAERMRTVLAIVIGLVLAVVVVMVTRSNSAWRGRALAGFVAVWFVACAVDTYAGVNAGYSLGEELLIHLVIFVVPALAAYLLARRLAPN